MTGMARHDRNTHFNHLITPLDLSEYHEYNGQLHSRQHAEYNDLCRLFRILTCAVDMIVAAR